MGRPAAVGSVTGCSRRARGLESASRPRGADSGESPREPFYCGMCGCAGSKMNQHDVGHTVTVTVTRPRRPANASGVGLEQVDRVEEGEAVAAGWVVFFLGEHVRAVVADVAEAHVLFVLARKGARHGAREGEGEEGRGARARPPCSVNQGR